MSSDTKSSDKKSSATGGPGAPGESARNGPAGPKKTGAAEAARQERLAQALRDNLKKRKAQQRQRRDGGA